MGEKRKKCEKREMFFNLCENYNRLMSESRGGWGDGRGIRTWWNVMKLMSWDYTMTACRYDINGKEGEMVVGVAAAPVYTVWMWKVRERESDEGKEVEWDRNGEKDDKRNVCRFKIISF